MPDSHIDPFAHTERHGDDAIEALRAKLEAAESRAEWAEAALQTTEAQLAAAEKRIAELEAAEEREQDTFGRLDDVARLYVSHTEFCSIGRNLGGCSCGHDDVVRWCTEALAALDPTPLEPSKEEP